MDYVISASIRPSVDQILHATAAAKFLKGLPFLQRLDEADPERKAVVMVGKRREESEARNFA